MLEVDTFAHICLQNWSSIFCSYTHKFAATALLTARAVVQVFLQRSICVAESVFQTVKEKLCYECKTTIDTVRDLH